MADVSAEWRRVTDALEADLAAARRAAAAAKSEAETLAASLESLRAESDAASRRAAEDAAAREAAATERAEAAARGLVEDARAELDAARAKNETLASKITKAVKKGKAIEEEKKRLEGELEAVKAANASADSDAEKAARFEAAAVSYTHLTLPTKA